MRQLLTIPVAAALFFSSCSTAFQEPQGSFLLNVEFPQIATSFTTMVIPSETDKIKVQLKTADDKTMERVLTRANPKLRIESLPLGDTEVKAQAFKGSEMLARGATKVKILPGLNTAELELENLDEKDPPPVNTTTPDISVELGGDRGPVGPPTDGSVGPPVNGPVGPAPDGTGPVSPGPLGPVPGDKLPIGAPTLTTGNGLPAPNTSGAGDSIINPRVVATAGTLAGPAASVALDPPTLSGAGYPMMLKVETPNPAYTYSWSCDSHCGTFNSAATSSATGVSTIFHTPTTGGTSVVRLKEMDASGNFLESTISIVVPSGTGSINLNQGVVG